MSIKKILISQAEPNNMLPYDELKDKYGVEIDFKPFYLIEPLSSKETRAQKIDILDFTAIVFSARQTIDAFFQRCEDLRIKIPDTMKYFCTTEAVALYLQKHIVFRKRKIFFGNGTPLSVIEQIGTKHKDEKFLITTSDTGNNEAMCKLFDSSKLNYTSVVFVKSVSQNLQNIGIQDYDLIVVYNPADLKSLEENFPGYKPEKAKFVTFGKQIVKAMQEYGLNIEVAAPTPEAPSVAKAIELYLEGAK